FFFVFFFFFFFFFQAEDGIRDLIVTGVQTCALPIWFGNWNFGAARPFAVALLGYWLWIIVSALFAANQSVAWKYVELHSKILLRSEERRVGKECRSRWSREHEKKKECRTIKDR